MNKPTVEALRNLSHEDFLNYAIEIMRRPENQATARIINASMSASNPTNHTCVWSIKIVTLAFGQIKLYWNCYCKIKPSLTDAVFEVPWDTEHRKTPMISWVSNSELFIEGCGYMLNQDTLDIRVHSAYFDQQNPYISAHFKHPTVSYCVDV